ncbi:MAG TPA: DNA-processing protein DprA [Syntrophales bacterium]|nr:DNA-processing protein DprA [Syntrophales bacterium]HOL59749.1 DNA-processing protein DprA [Syntrophales bacterium]HPO35895.1 DNA-processing protein DprA [Syntrophales bacterium]
MQSAEEIKYWLALKMVGGLSNGEVRTLLETLPTPRSVFETPKKALQSILKGNEKAIEEMVTFHRWEEAEKEAQMLSHQGAKIVTYRDPDFPALLKNIHDYPIFLYVKGHLDAFDVNVAIVGSRRASSYGIINAENLARGLALAGATIVSGMARGIDAAAHRGALSVQGRTIAVLGSGLDVIYPPEHRDLYDSIAEHGAVVTEYPFGTPPRSQNFPYRNRLISGMSWGVIVVEASEKSGSLITAKLAAEQGRAVFAVPGEIHSPLSRGTHRLLKEGATLIEDVSDVLEEIRPQVKAQPPAPPPSEKPSDLESRLYELIGPKPIHGDALIEKTGFTAGEVMGVLLTLELKGLIQQLPGQYYRRIK